MHNAYKNIAYVAGRMALSAVRGKTSYEQVSEWIRMLEEAVLELNAVRNQTQTGRHILLTKERSDHSVSG